MTATLHTGTGVWARTHRATLAILVLSMALAAALGLLAARLTAGSAVAPTTSVTTVDLHSPADGCVLTRADVPC